MHTLHLKDYEIASLIDSSFIPHAKGKVLKNICRLLFKAEGCYKRNSTISAETGTNCPNLIKWLVDEGLVIREMKLKADGSYQRILRYGKVLLELLGLTDAEKVKGGSPEVKHNSHSKDQNITNPTPPTCEHFQTLKDAVPLIDTNKPGQTDDLFNKTAQKRGMSAGEFMRYCMDHIRKAVQLQAPGFTPDTCMTLNSYLRYNHYLRPMVESKKSKRKGATTVILNPSADDYDTPIDYNNMPGMGCDF